MAADVAGYVDESTEQRVSYSETHKKSVHNGGAAIVLSRCGFRAKRKLNTRTRPTQLCRSSPLLHSCLPSHKGRKQQAILVLDHQS